MDKKMSAMILEDRLYDKKSLIWENGFLKEDTDEFDRKNIQEGRFGEFKIRRIKANIGFPVMIPVTKANTELANTDDMTDEEKILRMCTSTRFLELRKMNEEETVRIQSDLAKNSELFGWEKDWEISEIEEWIGLIDSGNYGNMLGTVSMVKGTDGYNYSLVYAGTGNFTDIRMEKNEILNFLYRRVCR